MFDFPQLAFRQPVRGIARTSLKTVATMALAILAIGLVMSQEAVANSKYASIVVDAHTGKTVYSRHADSHRFPASLTKIMTLYILFEELNAGRLKKSSMLKVSKRASGQPPSKLGLRRGQRISVENAIKALVTKSANDVAVVVAENIAGTERKFAKRMTKTAKRIGMKRTRFMNASGLPNRKQRTTARDMARLGIRIQRDFPKHYRYFKTKAFKYKGRTYRTHNRLLGRYRGTDGIKTGYIRASGFNLTSSVRRNGKHVVAVVMGGKTGRSRDRHMEALLNKNLPKASKRKKKKIARITTKPRPVARVTALPPIRKPAPVKPASISTLTTIDKSPPAAKPVAPAVISSTSEVDPVVAQTGIPVPALSKVFRKPETTDSPVSNTAVSRSETVVAKSDDGSSSDVTSPPKTVDDIIAAAGITDEPSDVGSADDGDLEASDYSGIEVKIESAAQQASDASADFGAKDTWSIQIGAYAKQEDALQRLNQAKNSGIPSLRDKKAIALAFYNEDQVLYRARFAGFDRKTAQRACTALKRKSIKCYPLAP